MKHNVTIEGTITTQSPLHISSPEELRCDPKTGRVFRGSTGGMPCTATRTQTMFSPAARSVGDDDQPRLGLVRYPVIPANGLRGRLRRAAAHVIESHITQVLGEKLTFPAYQVLHSGAVTGNPEKGGVSLDQMLSFREHVFLGLFGGGTRMLPGCLRVGTGYPMIERLREIGAIPESVDETTLIPDSQAWRLTEALPLVRNDDVLQMRDADAPTVIANYNDMMVEQLGNQIERRQRKGEGVKEEGDKNALQFIGFVEAVVAGLPFYTRTSVAGTKAQVGLLIKAMQGVMAQEGGRGIGGKSAIGFGQFAHALTIQADDLSPVSLFVDQQAELNLDDEFIQEALIACDEAIEKITSESLAVDLGVA